MTRALRVLHIASGDLWAGAEVQAFTLMSHLSRMPETEVAAILMNEGRLADRLRSAGISVNVLDERKTASLGILGQLRGLLRTWRPDIVHTHREKENILGSLANRSCRNVPSLRTVHGAKEYLASAGWRGVRGRLISGLDLWTGRVLQRKVVAVTRELGAEMAGLFSPEKVVVIENGVDSEEVRRGIRVADFKAVEPDAAHIGIAGRLVKVKRVDLFLEAAALLVQECPNRCWRFHVFGDGPMRRELEESSDVKRLAKRVMFHGHREDITTCIAGLDALVMCSDHEGMPMAALEAAALGVPVVAHAVGGLVAVVPDEFLITRHDASGYMDGILRVLRADGRAIAARCAAETLKQFSAQRNAERVRALYEQMLADMNDVRAEV